MKKRRAYALYAPLLHLSGYVIWIAIICCLAGCALNTEKMEDDRNHIQGRVGLEGYTIFDFDMKIADVNIDVGSDLGMWAMDVAKTAATGTGSFIEDAVTGVKAAIFR